MAPTFNLPELSSRMMSLDFGTPENSILTDDYMNEDRGPVLEGVAIGFAIFTTLVLGGRFYSKRFGGAALGLDDVFLTAAYAVNLGMCVLGIIMVKIGGVGKHIEAVEANHPDQLVGWAKTILVFEIVYFTSVALPKMAIVFLYLRVFNWRGAMRNAAILLQATIASTSISLIVAACFQCQPVAFWWDRDIEGGKCFDVQLFFHAQSVPSIILDLFIMALPVHTIWGLKLPTYKRVALLMIFLVASFGIVASIIRAIAFFDTSAFDDRTFASVTLVGWSIAETSTYIITACLPSLKPLVAHYTPQWLKEMVRKTISGASDSLSKHYQSRRSDDDDEVELTARSKHNHRPNGTSGTSCSSKKIKKKNSSPSSSSSPKSSINASRDREMEEDVTGDRDGWLRMGTESKGTLGFRNELGESLSPNETGTTTVVRNSGIHVPESAWGEDGIKVQTEVTIVRSLSSASAKVKGVKRPSRI